MLRRELRKFFLSRTAERDRFLTGDRPSEENFIRLFDSVGFIREPEDSAKVEEQGFVRLGENAEAVTNKFVTRKGDFSFVVQPGQLPEVIADPQATQIEGSTAARPSRAIEVNEDIDIGQKEEETFTLEEALNSDSVNTGSNNRFAKRFRLRLADNFLMYLIKRLLPTNGNEGDVLFKRSNSDFEAEWREAPIDRFSELNITGSTLIINENVNSYLLTNNGTAISSITVQNNGGNNIIPIPGFRLKLRAANQITFINEGNINLNSYEGLNQQSTASNVVLNPMDTATFVLEETEWVLYEVNSPEVYDRLLPEGGETGNLLVKTSNADYDADWQEVGSLPQGGVDGNVLRKTGSNDFEADWEDLASVPDGGTSGQVLTRIINVDGQGEPIIDSAGNPELISDWRDLNVEGYSEQTIAGTGLDFDTVTVATDQVGNGELNLNTQDTTFLLTESPAITNNTVIPEFHQINIPNARVGQIIRLQFERRSVFPDETGRNFARLTERNSTVDGRDITSNIFLNDYGTSVSTEEGRELILIAGDIVTLIFTDAQVWTVYGLDRPTPGNELENLVAATRLIGQTFNNGVTNFSVFGIPTDIGGLDPNTVLGVGISTPFSYPPFIMDPVNLGGTNFNYRVELKAIFAIDLLTTSEQVITVRLTGAALSGIQGGAQGQNIGRTIALQNGGTNSGIPIEISAVVPVIGTGSTNLRLEILGVSGEEIQPSTQVRYELTVLSAESV